MTVSADQRFTAQRPCPICTGYDAAPRGKGIRCGGYISEDGLYVHCTRNDGNGVLEQENGNTYAHALYGYCMCGVEHNPTVENRNGHGPKKVQEAVYQYRNADGSPAFEVVRYRLADGDKTFLQRHGPPSAYVWKCPEEIRVLYRLPELLASHTATVFICEGEKDVDNLRRLAVIATTNPMGAGKGKWLPKFNEYLRDRDCVLLPDNDDDGRKHMQAVAASLSGVARSIKIVELPGLPAKGDVSDWLATKLNVTTALYDLQALIDNTPGYTPVPNQYEHRNAPDNSKLGFYEREQGFNVERIRKVQLEPAKYQITIDGNDVTVTPAVLWDFKKLWFAVWDQTPQHMILPHIEPEQWSRRMRELSPTIENLETPEDASVAGVVWERVKRYLDMRCKAEELTSDTSGDTPIEADDAVYFRGAWLITYLDQQRGLKLKPGEVWSVVRAHGGHPGVKRFKHLVLRAWSIPLDALDEFADVEKPDADME